MDFSKAHSLALDRLLPLHFWASRSTHANSGDERFSRRRKQNSKGRPHSDRSSIDSRRGINPSTYLIIRPWGAAT